MYNIEAATSLALLQCTSPFNAYDIRGAYELWDRYKPESLVSVVKIPHSMNPEGLYTISNSLLKTKIRFQKS